MASDVQPETEPTSASESTSAPESTSVSVEATAGGSRRQFLRQSVVAGLASTTTLAWPNVLRAQPTPEYPTVLIGSGWWGRNIAREAIRSGRCRITAVCDPDDEQAAAAATELEALSGHLPKKYRDFREVLEREKPGIVIVASPDHWHPLQTIAAVQSGAHVYVEKPISHTIREGRAMVNAAQAADRVVQVGTHRRASPHNISGMEFLKSGKVGTIGHIRAFVHYPGEAGTPTPDAEPPAHLDWDLWVGPAPMRPFNPALHPKGFRSFLDFANGQLGDWGIHWMDQVLWWTEEQFPKRIASTGGRFIRQDSTDAPDTQTATFQFDRFTLTWEHRFYAANPAENHNIGCYFYGTNGTFHMGWKDGWTFYPINNKKAPIHQVPQLNQPDDQNIRELWTDFLLAIDHKRRPMCDIEIGYRSTNVSLLGMLAYKLGRSIQWDGSKEMVVDDPEANAMLRRDYRSPWVYPEIA